MDTWREATEDLPRALLGCAGIRRGEWYCRLEDGRCVHAAGFCRDADGQLLITATNPIGSGTLLKKNLS